MQHKNVVTFAVLVLASFSMYASKPCKFKGVCAVKSTVTAGVNGVVNKTTAVLDNKNTDRFCKTLVLGTAAYATYTYGPDLFKKFKDLATYKLAKKADQAQPACALQVLPSEGSSSATSSSATSSVALSTAEFAAVAPEALEADDQDNA